MTDLSAARTPAGNTPASTPVDTRPVDTRPIDTRPIDTRPIDTRPVDTTAPTTQERADLQETLTQHRLFLTVPAQGLTEEQIRQRSTVSELTIGGIIKHVTAAERSWVSFILEGPSAMAWDSQTAADWAAEFEVGPEETLGSLLAGYAEVAARSDEVLATLPSLDLAHPLPEAPWFEPDATWSARRVFLHIIAETAQHAGHADIIRESIDGAKSMG